MQPTEEVAWSTVANHTQGGRAVGGRLLLSQDQLSFQSNGVDAATGGSTWSAPLASIVGFEKVARTWNLRDGGLRTRLAVVLKDGSRQLFVVNDLDGVIARVQEALPKS
jgi:hypothetical protein